MLCSLFRTGSMCLWGIIFTLSPLWCQESLQQKPNVLIIMIDDLNDCIEGLGGHAQAITPNMTRLAQSGILFKRAYTNAPMCGPSRSSLFTGVYPHNSRNFFQAPWYNNEVLNNTRTLMEQFKEAGYNVLGSGKIMHHNRPYLWSHFEHEADYSPSPFDGEKRVPHPDVPQPFSDIGWVDGSLGPFINLEGRTNAEGKPLSWVTGSPRQGGFQPMRYINDENRDPTPDERNATWASETLYHLSTNPQEQPFLMAVGFLRPHTPLVAPQKYFDLFPLDELELAVIQDKDEEDTHLQAAYRGNVFTLKIGKQMFNDISQAYGSREAGLKAWTQAYLACVAAVDDNVGQVLNMLDQTHFRDNTLVILASDHGFHMGEKDYLYKNSLWEKSTRIPLIMRVPGITKPGSQTEAVVSLIDVYPTLLDLCGLSTHTLKNEQGHPLDGHSLRPILEKPSRKMLTESPGALTLVYSGPENRKATQRQHYALANQRYRYILYNTGQEELYDLKRDPYEWHNLAGNSGRHERIAWRMRKQLMSLIGPHVGMLY